jgi:hypothetical protein
MRATSLFAQSKRPEVSVRASRFPRQRRPSPPAHTPPPPFSPRSFLVVPPEHNGFPQPSPSPKVSPLSLTSLKRVRRLVSLFSFQAVVRTAKPIRQLTGVQPAVHKSMSPSCIPTFTGDQPGRDFDKSRLSLTAERQPPAPTRHHVFYFLPKTTQRGMVILLS